MLLLLPQVVLRNVVLQLGLSTAAAAAGQRQAGESGVAKMRMTGVCGVKPASEGHVGCWG